VVREEARAVGTRETEAEVEWVHETEGRLWSEYISAHLRLVQATAHFGHRRIDIHEAIRLTRERNEAFDTWRIFYGELVRRRRNGETEA
jgi:hypothetical protein